MEYKEEQVANLIISLKRLKGVGVKTIQNFLLENYDELMSINKYDENWLRNRQIKVISKGLEASSVSWATIQKQSSEILEKAYNDNIKVIHPYMNEYPKRLLTLNNFPPILYCIGNVELLNRSKIVAIIGTRNPTKMGEKIGLRLSEVLSKDGYTIVSGLAVGSDTIGHLGALNTQGYTIGILPTPIGSPVYPKENQKLADDIVLNKGLLISEYAPGTKLQGRELVSNLIARDEWQSGISDGVIAIETGVKGGTNHAIRHAIKSHTPVGIFDYSSQIGEEFFINERFGGNVKYIRNKDAFPIYTTESIENFKFKMKEYYEKSRLRFIDFEKRSKLDDVSKIVDQTKLF